MAVGGRLDWYFAYNLFRLAGIVQGIKKRVRDGTASHARAAEMAKRVPMLAADRVGVRKKGGRLAAGEVRLALLEEGGDAFAIVVGEAEAAHGAGLLARAPRRGCIASWSGSFP